MSTLDVINLCTIIISFLAIALSVSTLRMTREAERVREKSHAEYMKRKGRS